MTETSEIDWALDMHYDFAKERYHLFEALVQSATRLVENDQLLKKSLEQAQANNGSSYGYAAYLETYDVRQRVETALGARGKLIAEVRSHYERVQRHATSWNDLDSLLLTGNDEPSPSGTSSVPDWLISEAEPSEALRIGNAKFDTTAVTKQLSKMLSKAKDFRAGLMAYMFDGLDLSGLPDLDSDGLPKTLDTPLATASSECAQDNQEGDLEGMTVPWDYPQDIHR